MFVQGCKPERYLPCVSITTVVAYDDGTGLDSVSPGEQSLVSGEVGRSGGRDDGQVERGDVSGVS